MSNDNAAADYEDYGPWIFEPTKPSAIFNNHDLEEAWPPTIAFPGDLGVANTAADSQERDSSTDSESGHR